MNDIVLTPNEQAAIRNSIADFMRSMFRQKALASFSGTDEDKRRFAVKLKAVIG